MPQECEPLSVTAEQHNMASILDRVSAEVLETMFFDEAVAADCDHSWLADAISAHIGFQGSHRGDFLLSVSLEVAQSIAPAFLGVDPEDVNEAQRGQVLLELANILCGSVLSHLWPDSDLILEEPELIRAEGPLEGVHQCFLMPEGMLAVSIHISNAMEHR